MQHIEVSKLVKGRPLDNLEFMQWLKRYCDSINGGSLYNYNPIERREACKGGKDLNKKSVPGATTATPVAAHKGVAATVKSTTAGPRRVEISTSTAAAIGSRSAKPCSLSNAHSTQAISVVPMVPASQINALSEQITELKLSVDSLEKERDFYFAKLRDIEILCQDPDVENLPIVRAVQRILYAADVSPCVIDEAQAMISHSSNPSDHNELDEDAARRPRRDTNKRKSFLNPEVDEVAAATLSPRQRRNSCGDSDNLDMQIGRSSMTVN